MKTITTTYHGAGNVRGSKIIADDGDGNRLILHYDDAMKADKNHARAARGLCQKMGWGGRLQGGDVLKKGRTVAMAWAWIDKCCQIYVKPLKAFTHPA